MSYLQIAKIKHKPTIIEDFNISVAPSDIGSAIRRDIHSKQFTVHGL